jgi:hypothetical protein
MTDGPDGRVPQRRRRSPDSIWERYLTGKLSLEDKETLPALIKELHREIAQHLGHKVDVENPDDVESTDIDLPPAPPPLRKPTPIVDINVRLNHIAKRRRIDPRQN